MPLERRYIIKTHKNFFLPNDINRNFPGSYLRLLQQHSSNLPGDKMTVTGGCSGFQ